VWKYHLRQMAAADNPIAYLCRFLPSQDQAVMAETDVEQTAVEA